mgnify:CR=1 FL=1
MLIRDEFPDLGYRGWMAEGDVCSEWIFLFRFEVQNVNKTGGIWQYYLQFLAPLGSVDVVILELLVNKYKTFFLGKIPQALSHKYCIALHF